MIRQAKIIEIADSQGRKWPICQSHGAAYVTGFSFMDIGEFAVLTRRDTDFQQQVAEAVETQRTKSKRFISKSCDRTLGQTVAVETSYTILNANEWADEMNDLRVLYGQTAYAALVQSSQSLQTREAKRQELNEAKKGSDGQKVLQLEESLRGLYDRARSGG